MSAATCGLSFTTEANSVWKSERECVRENEIEKEREGERGVRERECVCESVRESVCVRGKECV